MKEFDELKRLVDDFMTEAEAFCERQRKYTVEFVSRIDALTDSIKKSDELIDNIEKKIVDV